MALYRRPRLRRLRRISRHGRPRGQEQVREVDFLGRHKNRVVGQRQKRQGIFALPRRFAIAQRPQVSGRIGEHRSLKASPRKVVCHAEASILGNGHADRCSAKPHHLRKVCNGGVCTRQSATLFTYFSTSTERLSELVVFRFSIPFRQNTLGVRATPCKHWILIRPSEVLSMLPREAIIVATLEDTSLCTRVSLHSGVIEAFLAPYQWRRPMCEAVFVVQIEDGLNPFVRRVLSTSACGYAGFLFWGRCLLRYRLGLPPRARHFGHTAFL
mmetsp:Transcript_112924/g.319368  ORF Transcript_112924/g.319368 Transcript_112924/m.319368 type:complete len:270 (+) Transcript_112924:292-1101(+)